MSRKNNIIFFFPSRTLGGVQTLFIRLIKRLNIEGFNVSYMDFSDGVIRKELASFQEIPFYDINGISDEQLSPESEQTVVTAFCFIHLATSYFHKKSKFLLWFLSPYNLPIKNLGRKFGLKKSTLSLLQRYYCGTGNYARMLNYNSVYFMDSLCFEENGEPSTSYDPYLPLYLELPKSDKSYNLNGRGKNLAWVGRIDESIKFNCVVYLLERFEKLKKQNGFHDATLTIIGDGAGSKKIEKLCKNSEVSSDIKIIKSLPYNELYDYLLMKIDVVFAHGTTCLESASVGIPTVCLDGYIRKFPDNYQFKWLFDRKIYDVGRTDFDLKFSSNGYSLAEIISMSITERHEVSSRCRKVISCQYENDVVFSKFLNAVNNSKGCFEDINVNLFTLAIDSIVHWFLVKKIYFGLFRGHINRMFL